MTTMRVTVGSLAYSGLASINDTSSKLAKLQAQMSSGKQILTPSDDPTGTVQAMRLRSEMAVNDQYTANSTDALSWLTAADTAYGTAVNLVTSAQTTVLQGLNTGTNDANSNQALAQKIDGLRSQLLAVANSDYNGRPVFGGTTAGGVAYDSSGTYVGDTGSVTRAISNNNVVTVSAQGPDVFGSGSSNVFTMLSNISTALRSNPSTLTSSSITDLKTALSQISSAQAAEGATFNQVQQAQTQQTSTGTAMQTQLSSIEDIDPAEMAIKLTTANTAYQAALQTTASVRQLSLLDFLR